MASGGAGDAAELRLKNRWMVVSSVLLRNWPAKELRAHVQLATRAVGQGNYDAAEAALLEGIAATGSKPDLAVAGHVDFHHNLGWLVDRNKADRPYLLSILLCIAHEFKAHAALHGKAPELPETPAKPEEGAAEATESAPVRPPSIGTRRDDWIAVTGTLLRNFRGEDLQTGVREARRLVSEGKGAEAVERLAADVAATGFPEDTTLSAHVDFKANLEWFVDRHKDDRHTLLCIALAIAREIAHHQQLEAEAEGSGPFGARHFRDLPPAPEAPVAATPLPHSRHLDHWITVTGQLIVSFKGTDTDKAARAAREHVKAGHFDEAIAVIDEAIATTGWPADIAIGAHVDYHANFAWLVDRNKTDRHSLLSIARATLDDLKRHPPVA